jgi:hypothetical protein
VIEPTVDKAQLFAATLAKSGSLFQNAALNSSALQGDCQAALRAATDLLRYRDYLAVARAYKASGAGRANDIDTQVLFEARSALSRMQTLATSTLRVVGSLSRGGALDQMTASWRQAAEAAGTVSTLDLWKHATAINGNGDAMGRAGIDAAFFAALDDTLGTIDLRVSAAADRVVIAGQLNGKAVDASLATTPLPRRAATVPDLLTRGRFAAISNALERREPAYLYGAPFAGNDLRVEDVALYAALATNLEGIRHVRKLEDTGLATYVGSDPGSLLIGLLIAGVVLMSLGVTFDILFCAHQQPAPVGTPVSGWCTAAHILGFLGVALLILSWVGVLGGGTGSPGKPADLSTGSVLIRGVLKDFQVSLS